MTNFGALAVLAALREHDARSPRGQRRLRTVRTQSLLTALETFPAGADGWREVAPRSCASRPGSTAAPSTPDARS